MRKVFVFIIFIALLAAYQLNGFFIATSHFNGKYSIYKKNKNIESEYDLTLAQAVWRKFFSKDISGESVKFFGKDQDIDYIIEQLDITIVDEQNFANIRTIYGYSSRLGQGVEISGEQVNIQIAKRGAEIIVGTPLILGSY